MIISEFPPRACLAVGRIAGWIPDPSVETTGSNPKGGCLMQRMVRKIFLCSLALFLYRVSGDAGSASLSMKSKNATDVLVSICEAISASTVENRNLTFIFVLYTTSEFRSSFNFLWNLPSSLVYLSTDYIHLKANERQIILSWERDYQPTLRPVSEYWDLHKVCGTRSCDHVIGGIDRFHVEKRVLIQVRELKPYEVIYDPAVKIRRILRNYLSLKYYYHHYLSTLVVVRKENKDTFHSSHIIKRSDRAVGSMIVELMVKELETRDAEHVFDAAEYKSNVTHTIDVEFSGIHTRIPSLPGSSYPILLNSCFPVSLSQQNRPNF